MDLRDITKINCDITYFQAMKYIFVILSIVGIISSYPSINTNFKYLSSIDPERAKNTFFFVLFVVASIFIDITKIVFLSTFIRVRQIFNGRIDSILTFGVLIFFSLSFFFSVNGINYQNNRQQAEILKNQIMSDSINIINLNKKSTRAERKKAEANNRQLANLIQLKKQTEEKTTKFEKLKTTLRNKDFHLLLFMDLICIFCVLSCSYIASTKNQNTEKEQKRELDKETVKSLQSRYRAAASRNDKKNIDKYREKLLLIGAKVPQSKTNHEND